MGASPSRVPKNNTYLTDPCTVDELMGTLDTGDMILFRGNSMSAWWIRWYEMCDYSHVAMVHIRTLDGDSEPTMCIWESVCHLDNLHCLLHGRVKSGPRLVSLRDKLNDYIAGSGTSREVRLCVVKLRPQPVEARMHLDQNLAGFEDHTCNRSYYPSPMGVVGSAMGVWQLPMGDDSLQRHGAAPRTDYTCEQLIACTLVKMGAYTPTLDVNKIHLKSFLDGSIPEHDRQLAVLDQINYHMIVKPPPPPAHGLIAMNIFQEV